MKLQKIQIFICIMFLALLGGLFSPAITITGKFEPPKTSKEEVSKDFFSDSTKMIETAFSESMKSQLSEANSSSTFFDMFAVLFEEKEFNMKIVAFTYPFAIVLSMLTLLLISYFRNYEWLFTLGFVLLVFTCSCLYNIAINMQEKKDIYFSFTYGFGWILYIMISGTLTLYGFFLMINNNQEKT